MNNESNYQMPGFLQPLTGFGPFEKLLAVPEAFADPQTDVERTEGQAKVESMILDLSALVPLAALIVTVAAFVISYVMFIVQGGYAGMVPPSDGLITSPVVVGFMALAMVAEIAMTYILLYGPMFKSSKLRMVGTAALVTSGVLLVSIVVPMVLALLLVSAPQNNALYGFLGFSLGLESWVLRLVLLVASAALFIAVCVKSPIKYRVGFMAGILVLCFIINPLVLAILENIVGIVAFVVEVVKWVLTAALLIGVLVIGGKLFGGGGGETASESSGSAPSGSVSSKPVSSAPAPKRGKPDYAIGGARWRQIDDHTIVLNMANQNPRNVLNMGYRFCIQKGFTGGTRVVMDYAVGTRELCSVSAVERGDITLLDSRNGSPINVHRLPSYEATEKRVYIP